MTSVNHIFYVTPCYVLLFFYRGRSTIQRSNRAEVSDKKVGLSSKFQSQQVSPVLASNIRQFPFTCHLGKSYCHDFVTTVKISSNGYHKNKRDENVRHKRRERPMPLFYLHKPLHHCHLAMYYNNILFLGRFYVA